MLARLRQLALVALVAVLIPTACNSDDALRVTTDRPTEQCDQRCEQQLVTWYLASLVTLERQWYGAVIASQPAAQCVAHHESRGDYHAENAVSTASGKYQFVDGTFWNVAVARGRTDLPRHAASAPSWEQEASFWWAWTHIGPSPWRGSGCY